MHVEIKGAMFNFVTFHKSRGQPNIYFRTHVFRNKVLHQHCLLKWKKQFRVGTKKGRVGHRNQSYNFNFA